MKKRNYGQTATEYMLILAGVAAVTLIGFKTYLPRVTDLSGTYFNRTASGIVGKPNPCGDGFCNTPHETDENCCADCGSCSVAAPAVDGGWCSFGPCSQACGGGIQSRSCSCPPPSAGGDDCDGPASIACNTFDCPPVPTCEYSDWSACLDAATHSIPVLCGGGEMLRTCSCGAGNCAGGAAAETAVCNTQACVGGHWSTWSACSVPCGGEGIISRTCVLPSDPSATLVDCSALGNVDTQRCYNGPCPAAGTWCAWGYDRGTGFVANLCSVDCNGGIMTRTCECPPPVAGGAFCPDSGYTTVKVDLFTQTCNTQACTCIPVSGPANSTVCTNDDNLAALHIYVPQTIISYGTCSVPQPSPYCEWACNLGYRVNGPGCSVNQCAANAIPLNNIGICMDGGVRDDEQIPDAQHLISKLAVLNGACTLGRKCEWQCPPWNHISANNCILSTCGGSPIANATLCASDDIQLPSGGINYTAIPTGTCSATKCEYQCWLGYHVSGNSCVLSECSPSSAPINTTMCASDNVWIPDGETAQVIVETNACTARKCEWYCNLGYHLSGGICILSNCTGTVPTNATMCANDNLDLPSGDVPRTLVGIGTGSCTATKCEYYCPLGYWNSGPTTCSLAVCTGTVPTNATMCTNDNVSLPNGNEIRTVVGNGSGSCTTTAKCEYYCPLGYYRTSATMCTLAVCTGTVPANGTLCTNDDINLPSGNVARTLVGTGSSTCTAGTYCEYYCPLGYYKNGAVCTLAVCTGTTPLRATMCANDNINLPNGNLPKIVVGNASSACTSIKCQWYCNSGWPMKSCSGCNMCCPANSTGHVYTCGACP